MGMKNIKSGYKLLASIPYVGTPPTEAGVFDPTTGLDLTSDYDVRTEGPIRGVRVVASGNLHVTYVNGSEEVIPIVVIAGHYHELRGHLIQTIHSDSTCYVGGAAATSGIKPLF